MSNVKTAPPGEASPERLLPEPALMAAPLSSFIGREEELARLGELLRSGGARLITLTGPGGIGKTRLAIELGRRLQPAFPDGVQGVELASLRDGDLLAIAVAQQLGVPVTDARTALERIAAALGTCRSLIVIDNAEHVVEPVAELVALLLRRARQLTFLVTSRAPLALYGERVFPLQPLDSPRGTGNDFAAIAGSPAVRLFVDRATSVDPRFALTADNAATIAEICARLEGIPLALELAASRTAMLAPPALLARLQRRLPILSATIRDAGVERAQSMRETIAWSYDLLPAEEQRLFRRLSIFAGGFSPDAVEAVCLLDGSSGGSFTDPAAALIDQIGSLAARSFLQLDTGHRYPDPRYLMYETIREYGLEQLAGSGELGEIARRHAGFFAGWARACWEEAGDLARLQHWLNLLEANHDNLRAALDWLEANDPAGALAMAGHLHWFWNVRGHRAEGLKRIEPLLTRDETASDLDRARAYLVAGNLAHLQRDRETVRRWLDQSMTLWNRAGSDWGRGVCHLTLGMVAKDHGDYAAAEQDLLAALPLLEAAGDDAAGRTARANLAAVEFAQRDFAAMERWLQTLESGEDERVTRSGGWTIHLRGLADVAQGQGQQALERFHQCFHLFVVYGYPLGILESLAGAAAAMSLGNASAAATLFGVVDTMRRELDYAFQQPGKDVYLEAIARARDRLGAAYDARHREGQRLSSEEAGQLLHELVANPEQPVLVGTDPDASPAERFGLTAREVEVLELAALGRSDAEIADRLYISHRTVARHLFSVYRKLGVHTRTAAGALAFAHGLVERPLE
jgi:non-specific serine/threonine protein kinase